MAKTSKAPIVGHKYRHPVKGHYCIVREVDKEQVTYDYYSHGRVHSISNSILNFWGMYKPLYWEEFYEQIQKRGYIKAQ